MDIDNQIRQGHTFGKALNMDTFICYILIFYVHISNAVIGIFKHYDKIDTMIMRIYLMPKLDLLYNFMY